MLLLFLFAFLAGVVTVASPCVLPVLPIILSSTVPGEHPSKSRPLGVVVGFVLSFTVFTLFLSALVRVSGIPSDALRIVSIIVIAIFGLSLLVPRFQLALENLSSKLTQLVPAGATRKGFHGGLLIGLSLGLLWTPCVGPILASVIALAVTGSVSFSAFVITFAYALGTALPMFAIIQGGRALLQKVPWLLRNTGKIQKAFGVIMIVTALGLYFNVDRTFQTFVLNTFPQYGVGLTQLEKNNAVADALKKLSTPTTGPTIGSPAAELIAGGAWINSDPLTLASLRGKVVIVDFWTYSCINCQRTLPYMEKWYKEYADKGLVIIGVHAPEFEFEKEEGNVRQAVSDFGLTYPVMQDNNFATWRAYNNQYWPAKYFIDKNGVIRYTHFGEGNYDESEQEIQTLLAETGATDVNMPINNPETANYAGTPESYLGYARLQRFASREKITPDASANYTISSPLPSNYLGYAGTWNIGSEYAHPQKGSELDLNFTAGDVYLVARPTGVTGTMHILVDGVAQDFGTDVNNGVVTIDKDRLYNLVHLTTPGQHTLRILFDDNNVDVYAFTFG